MTDFERAIDSASSPTDIRSLVLAELKARWPRILADGRIDASEVGELVAAIRPVEGLFGDDLRAFLQALRSSVTDGNVNAGESARLSAMYSAVIDPSEEVCPRCERHFVRGSSVCPWCDGE